MTKKSNWMDLGLLILRLGIGISMFMHGLPKLTGGVDVWTGLGSTMSVVGINFAPAFWGFMAAFSEAIGGLLFAIGFLHRPAALLLIGTMSVALFMHVSNGDDFSKYSHAMELLIVFVATFVSGPGKYSVDAKYLRRIA